MDAVVIAPARSPAALAAAAAVAAAAAPRGAGAEAAPGDADAATVAGPLAALIGRAQALQAAGRADAAAALYARWRARHPQPPLAQVAAFNHGTLLSALERLDEAEAAYRDALAHDAAFHQPRLNLGHLMERRGRPEEALACWQAVADAEPPPPLELRRHALNNRARLLEQLHRYPEAEALMRASLELDPAQRDVVQHLVHIRQKQCAWPHDAPVGDVTPHQFLTGTSLLATMGLSDDPALQLLAAQRFVHERVPAPPRQALHAQRPPRQGRIRIGYLSGDLHLHAVGLLAAELLELHDRGRVEVWAFCWTPESEQPQRRRLRAAVDRLVPIGALTDAQAAAAIADAGIDVLIDLQGLTNGARPAILGHRAAPVQVSYLGLPGTAALPGVEWMLADRFVMPPELLPYCTEKPLYLPHCFQVSDRQRQAAAVPTRAACGLPEDAFVYCSFNNNHKFTPETFGAWMRTLAAVPGSVLWLLADNDTARDNLRREAAARGVDAQRLVFAPRAAPAEYLARFAVADLMLDTFPFNAGTTASDALWMGLPIVTRAGRTYISRMCGSLLHAVGLPDLVAHSAADYERLAVAIGRHPARAASVRRYLVEHGRASPLFDVPAIVRAIEDALLPLAHAARARHGAAGGSG